jgi:hypothetical protein
MTTLPMPVLPPRISGSEISVFLIIYIIIAFVLSLICIRIFKQNDYHAYILSKGLSEMSYSVYIMERIRDTFTETVSEISQKIEEFVLQAHSYVIRTTYPSIARNIIYRNNL